MAILELTRKNPQLAINKCNKVYGACRHRPRFHRFDQSQTKCNANTCTDELAKDERAPRPDSTTSKASANSLGSFNDKRDDELLSPRPGHSNTLGYQANRTMGLAACAMMKRDNTLMVEPPHPDDVKDTPIMDLAPKDDTGDLLLGANFVDV